MFDPITLALIGGALGGLLDKNKPLRGAALGAAGGYFAPGLIGGASAAGGSGAAGASAGGSMSGGLLSSAGTQAAAPITDLSVRATPQMLQSLSANAGQSGGLMSAIKPVGGAMVTAQAAQGLLAPNEPTPAPPVQTQPLDLSGVLNANQQEQARQLEEDMRRRQSLSDFASYAMKGGR